MSALTPQQVADALQCSVSTVYRRVRDGSIPSLRLGHLVRVPASWLDAQGLGDASTPARAEQPPVVPAAPLPAAGGVS